MKGIVLAGGNGTRLYPLTLTTSKQLLPVHNKPLIYYPISVLMQAKIKDILIISTPKYLPLFETLLGNGERFSVNFSYKEQTSPDGLAQAFIIGKEFIGSDNVSMILGDNIFLGQDLPRYLADAASNAENGKGATVFSYYVNNPEKFGIVELDADGNPLSIEEKPEKPKSNYCVTGLYFFDKRAVEFAESLKPSKRGELEITDLNRIYLKLGKLNIKLLGKEFVWFDAGTHESLAKATNFIRKLEAHQHRKIACLEDIAYLNGWINRKKAY